MSYPADSAAASGLVLCHVCLNLEPECNSKCGRCGAPVHVRHPNSLQQTLALLVTATLLYIPANILPIMDTITLGRKAPSTIIGGVIFLIELGDLPIASVIFIASVVVPSSKLAALYFLVWSVYRGHDARPKQHNLVYRIAELVGRWSMVDVFVVSILVALIQLGQLLTILPGVAALAFAGVVVVTMLAAESFDQRLIWDRAENADE